MIVVQPWSACRRHETSCVSAVTDGSLPLFSARTSDVQARQESSFLPDHRCAQERHNVNSAQRGNHRIGLRAVLACSGPKNTLSSCASGIVILLLSRRR